MKTLKNLIFNTQDRYGFGELCVATFYTKRRFDLMIAIGKTNFVSFFKPVDQVLLVFFSSKLKRFSLLFFKNQSGYEHLGN